MNAATKGNGTMDERFEATCAFIAKHVGDTATDAEVAHVAVAVVKAFVESVREAGAKDAAAVAAAVAAATK